MGEKLTLKEIDILKYALFTLIRQENKSLEFDEQHRPESVAETKKRLEEKLQLKEKLNNIEFELMKEEMWGK